MMKIRNWFLGMAALCMAFLLSVPSVQSVGENPATGETFDAWPLIALLVLSVAGLAVVLIMKIKTRK